MVNQCSPSWTGFTPPRSSRLGRRRRDLDSSSAPRLVSASCPSSLCCPLPWSRQPPPCLLLLQQPLYLGCSSSPPLRPFTYPASSSRLTSVTRSSSNTLSSSRANGLRTWPSAACSQVLNGLTPSYGSRICPASLLKDPTTMKTQRPMSRRTAMGTTRAALIKAATTQRTTRATSGEGPVQSRIELAGHQQREPTMMMIRAPLLPTSQ